MAMKLVRFDWAMKHLLRDKANYSVLEGFLPLAQDVRLCKNDFRVFSNKLLFRKCDSLLPITEYNY